ncbi:hypothetical protein C5E11_03875 [Clavibacter michiganensis]|nr:hypothetical protein [Clavibacter michiganensis]PPF64540.1 hypothetical protein C5E11_03875 [Clavibacter michiganensis]
MADPLVIEADLILFLTSWYRDFLEGRDEAVCGDVLVTDHEPLPGEEWPEKMLIISDGGGFQTSFLTSSASVRLNILAGTKENPTDADDLARIVHAARSQIPAAEPGNPVTAVLGSTRPVAVREAQPRARRYLTLTLGVVGSLL